MRLACYQPDIALNVGAMIRICACFNAGIDIIEPCGFPFSLKAVRRAAMDYAAHTDIVRHVSWASFHQHTTSRIILLTTKTSNNIWNFNFQQNDTVLVGQESAGIPEDIHNMLEHRVTIPISLSTRSLNVSTAAAIALAEATRQHTAQGQQL